MTNPVGESSGDVLRLGFDRRLMLGVLQRSAFHSPAATRFSRHADPAGLPETVSRAKIRSTSKAIWRLLAEQHSLYKGLIMVDWSARWCSLDEIGDARHFIFTYDGSAEGLARAHAIIETAVGRFAVTLESEQGPQTGFWKCPASNSLVIVFESAVAVVNLEEPARNAVLDIHYVAGPPLVSANCVILWSFWAITLIASVNDVQESRYDDADIEAVVLLHDPERVEARMFVPCQGEIVTRTLML